MGCGCRKKVATQKSTVPVKRVNPIDLDYEQITVRCMNCKGSLRGVSGEVYIAGSDKLITTARHNVALWKAQGYEFEELSRE